MDPNSLRVGVRGLKNPNGLGFGVSGCQVMSVPYCIVLSRIGPTPPERDIRPAQTVRSKYTYILTTSYLT
ncbi:hypothetical protein BO70DRAFT_95014 [Aspergillus heteromorphus CBS 117.55]|uniref:Uncharacterized protein n=1 Tax=Aspergillus heteromorphus CBS 117.55 TaxID=1448321 RepID=A0A317VLV6_9EURO|nr:uncharacterized protein BO70DRAFT_95014 [Aspergillus heteromorphus CBS 117.55]PWY75353.1 hypothetical protein BO70DRAFT_95014 [Aspergillus heteromorphus CBS 117.55]